MTKYIMLSLLGCGCFFQVFAQQYTLDECQKEALRNNAIIKNARNDVSAARHWQQETFTAYFPSVSATCFGFTTNNGLLQMEAAPGMDISMLKDGIVGGISASMPILAGKQITNANKLANINMDVNHLRYRQSENEVMLTTEQYFWQIVMLKEKLKTLSFVEDQLTNIYKDVKIAVDAGVSNRNDLLQVQLRKNEIRSNRFQIENLLSVTHSLLAQYIGHPSEDIETSVTLSDSLPPHPDSLYCDPLSSLTRTNEYGLLEENVKVTSLQYKMAVNKHLPTIAVGGGYT